MENITLFVSIVIIVFGVLQIVLFFKLWGMTNDVKIIKNKKESERIDILLNEAQIYNLSNNKEDAFESYKKAFYTSVSNLYNQTKGGNPIWISEYWKKNYPNIVSYYKRHVPSDIIDFKEYDSFDKVDKILSGNN